MIRNVSTEIYVSFLFSVSLLIWNNLFLAQEEEEEDEGRAVEQATRGSEVLQDEATEESNLEISQNESELEMNSEMDTSCEVEAKPEPQIKQEPDAQVEQLKISKVEEDDKEASISDDSSQDIKPEIKQEFVTEEKAKDQVMLPFLCWCQV
jgi:hypothetical protein